MKLKPCPFCGGEARVILKTYGIKEIPPRITNTYVVGCDQCCIYTSYHPSNIWQGEDGAVNIEANGAMDAIEVWNKRAR